MGQKVHPTSFRLGIIKRSYLQWYINKTYYYYFIREDNCIYRKVYNFCNYCIILKIYITRIKINIRIRIYISKFYIRWKFRQTNLQTLRKKLKEIRRNFCYNYFYSICIFQFNSRSVVYKNIQIFICNFRNPKIQAFYLIFIIIHKLEKQIFFRWVMESKQKSAGICKKIVGIRTQISGRLNGIEIARIDNKEIGNIPLITIINNLDFSSIIAYMNYGIMGIKVWIFQKVS